ncbi:uncharacterized protein PRCAT00004396001 [Priceomyces carsonii]|uniref:uncharacterized protein n=1 Tax=Priceomyces carsonii TaxID=28549 RepID=UPI002EDB58E0|nr:unnamed protein product [Priceomyces carsonii]
MGAFGYTETIEGDIYIQRLSSYIRRNEEALANGLLCFSKNRGKTKVRPLRLSFSLHHLYYITERIDSCSLGVDVGPLNIKLDIPNHEPTFILFMANNAKNSKHYDNDTRSISSISSVKSIVSSTSVYWRSFGFNKDPKLTNKELRYLYSSFTKIPCLIISPKTKVSSITSYEEYPCDTLVPVRMFKNLQVLEIVDYEPNEIFGWNTLSDQLRILIIKNSKTHHIEEVLFNLVIDDESGRSSFISHKQTKKHNNHFNGVEGSPTHEAHEYPQYNNNAFKYPVRARATTTGTGSLPKELELNDILVTKNPKDYQTLDERRWSLLKQLTVSETSITSIPPFVFKPLGNLVKLTLSNNLLEELPEGLDQLTNIKYLNFSDNYLTDLTNLPKNLPNLTTLSFNNNKIKDIRGLEDLISLEKIDLRKNELVKLSDLKPIVLLFKNIPHKFDNVYLSGNRLLKTYRTDLFNLFNGVRFKSQIKIDDSRPGYFEGALLLDATSSEKALDKFLKKTARLTPISIDTPPILNNISDLNGNLKTPEHPENLTEPFATYVTIGQNENLQPSPTRSFDSSTRTPTKQPGVSLNQVTVSSPLSNNQNFTNKLDQTSLQLKHATAPAGPCKLSPSSGPSADSMRRSSAFNPLDSSAASKNAAPNIITHVQVTARMST